MASLTTICKQLPLANVETFMSMLFDNPSIKKSSPLVGRPLLQELAVRIPTAVSELGRGVASWVVDWYTNTQTVTLNELIDTLSQLLRCKQLEILVQQLVQTLDQLLKRTDSIDSRLLIAMQGSSQKSY